MDPDRMRSMSGGERVALVATLQAAQASLEAVFASANPDVDEVTRLMEQMQPCLEQSGIVLPELDIRQSPDDPSKYRILTDLSQLHPHARTPEERASLARSMKAGMVQLAASPGMQSMFSKCKFKVVDHKQCDGCGSTGACYKQGSHSHK